MNRRFTNYLTGLLLVALLTSCRTNYNAHNSSASQPPADADKVTLPVSEGIGNNYKDFQKLGYQKDVKIPNFSLYSLEGTKFTLSEALAKRKPLLLISGSYTCDISRHNIADVNALASKYRDKLNIYMVYTIDAHPVDVPSPYSKNNKIELAPANVREHIEARQPKTYGERKSLAKKWQQQNYISTPVLVDNPTNDFWLSFGQAPNMAYLIAPNGTVYYKQPWLKYVALDNTIKDWLHEHPNEHMSP